VAQVAIDELLGLGRGAPRKRRAGGGDVFQNASVRPPRAGAARVGVGW
jgi:hypothetical protein